MGVFGRRLIQGLRSSFFDSANRIFASDYIPSPEDILRYQQGLTIRKSILKHGSSTFNIIEVPWKEARLGHLSHQRYGRPGVVLFVVALSDYNQAVSDADAVCSLVFLFNTMTNSSLQTRTIMDESLAAFELAVNSRWLANTIIVRLLLSPLGTHSGTNLNQSVNRYWFSVNMINLKMN